MRALILALVLVLGWCAPLHAGPPVISTADQRQGPEVASALVVHVHFIANRAQGFSLGAILFEVGATSTRSAWSIQYAYCGGDPVNRMDPSGLDWVETDDNGDVYWVPEWWTGKGIPPSGARAKGGKGGSSYDTANRVKIGTISGMYVDLEGGGRARLDSLQSVAGGMYLGGYGADHVRGVAADATSRLYSPFNLVAGSSHVGIFFDGTGSFLPERSNVVADFYGYEGSRFYFGGVGNTTEFNVFGRMAGGGWGDQFDENISQAIRDVQRSATANGGSIMVDFWGFSRGAAQAVELARAIQAADIPGVTVNFLGLYDPVYSVGFMTPGQSSNYIRPGSSVDNYVIGDMPTNVAHAAVAYAGDEQRTWFPWTKFFPNGITEISRRVFRGVHSDDGGYHDPNDPSKSNNRFLMLRSRSWMARQAQAAGVPRSSVGTAPEWALASSSRLSDALGIGLNNPGGYGAQATQGINMQWPLYKLLPWRWSDDVSFWNHRPRHFSGIGGAP